MKYSIYYICLIYLYIACTQASNSPPQEQAETKSAISSSSQSFLVDTLSARHQILPYTLHATARVQMAREAELSFPQAGKITNLYLTEGARVKKGQLLAQLDTAALQLAYTRAQDALLKAEIDRKDRLILHTQAGTDTLTPQQQLTVDIASGYRQAQMDVRAARLQLRGTKLIAPFSGLLTDVKARAFQQIGAGDLVASLVDPTTPLLRVGILERELSHIYLGQLADVTLSALSGQQFQAKVIAINPRVDESGLIYLNVRILKPNGRIFSGMNAELRLKDSRSQKVVVVPVDAVLQRSGKEIIFTYEEGLAKWKYIKTGRKNGEYVEILEGLDVGEKVIVKGHLNLGHDAKVIIDS